MDILALYTTNTLHLIVFYCGLREQLTLVRANRALSTLREKYLPPNTMVLLKPERYCFRQDMPLLITALKTCLEPKACISRDRSAQVLLVLRNLIPVHVVQVEAVASETITSLMLPEGSLFDMDHTVTSTLHKKCTPYDKAPPVHSRVLFALDTKGILAYNTLVKCRDAMPKKGWTKRAYLKRLGGCEGSISQTIYSVKQYYPGAQDAPGKITVGSKIENLFEVMLWYIWVTEYVPGGARCNIRGYYLERNDLDHIGVSGMIKSL